MAEEKKPTRSKAMLMICHNCMGEYYDGRNDCEIVTCPMYFWMPYRKKKPDLEWMKFNPRKKGMVTWEESKRDMTDEQREAIAERARKMGQARAKAKAKKGKKK